MKTITNSCNGNGCKITVLPSDTKINLFMAVKNSCNGNGCRITILPSDKKVELINA
jgi:dihydroxyacetone kinase